MYTQRDKDEMRNRLVRYSLLLLPVLAGLIALFVVGLKRRWMPVVLADGAMIFAVICFVWSLYLYPCIRYLWFLRDMGVGLTREMAGSVVEVSDKEDYQDGVRVLPVRLYLDDEDDERIVYLNASKAEGFPGPGTHVRVRCYGRHIKEVV